MTWRLLDTLRGMRDATWSLARGTWQVLDELRDIKHTTRRLQHELHEMRKSAATLNLNLMALERGTRPPCPACEAVLAEDHDRVKVSIAEQAESHGAVPCGKVGWR